ncbi:hypothetical protein [Sphaerisporangium corydalis]|uniref:Uncharacterized protein n=1 Tax=Sphaerisporangium corydalis TaxID=1441875 RepID=A0ABV9EQ52_9ACTN|nr:hypothetical protein [Sphaerisporangium corydalis]
MAVNTTTRRSLPGAREQNESAVTFAWLAAALGISSDTGPAVVSGPEGLQRPAVASGPAVVAGSWAEIRDGMRRPSGHTPPSPAEWMSDPWLARGLSGGVPSWSPPDGIDEWPDHGVGRMVDALARTAWRTRHRDPSDLLAAGPSGLTGEGPAAAAARLRELEARAPGPADGRAVRAGHVRVWLGCAVGPLLGDVMLTPGGAPGDLAELTAERLALPRQIKLPTAWDHANPYAERHLDLMYNLRMSPGGRLSFPGTDGIRGGQGEGWREHWAWLSRDTCLGDVSEAVRLAARLMRSDPVVEGLLRTARSDDPYLRMVAPAVARRWLLTLKAMAWLEDAARHDWAHMRPKDLACFAFNAVKPGWPRRVVAISHRSGDTKSALSRTALWSSSRCAIDASHVPSWETNTGMIWGLFGATPAIVRVRSPGYERSVWCLREAELTRYLVERSDFMSERWVLDIEPSDLASLDAAYSAWSRDTASPDPGSGTSAQNTATRDTGSGAAVQDTAARAHRAEAAGSGDVTEAGRAGGRASPGVPERCRVRMPDPMPVWEVAMMRAGAALRVINTLLASADLTNRFVAEFLLGDADFPGPAPTGNPGGWQDYRAIFREFQSLCAPGTAEPAVRLPFGYDAEQMALDREMLGRVPDLDDPAQDRGVRPGHVPGRAGRPPDLVGRVPGLGSRVLGARTGTAGLRDALVAFEYLRTEWPLLAGEQTGGFLAVDHRGLSHGRWASDERLSLQRGLLTMRAPVPVWIVQSAGQGVENWRIPGDHPIFTEHFPQQFSWMREGRRDRREARSRFPARSGLDLSPELRHRCHESG